MAIDVEISDGIATVTMNRPEALNAFSPEQLEWFKGALHEVGLNPTVRAVILTGAGDRAFAAGADIRAMAEMSAAEGLEFARSGHAVASALERLPQPVIAAVNGYAFGGGGEVGIAFGILLVSGKDR